MHCLAVAIYLSTMAMDLCACDLFYSLQFDRVRRMMTTILLSSTEDEIQAVAKEALDECILENQSKFAV